MGKFANIKIYGTDTDFDSATKLKSELDALIAGGSVFFSSINVALADSFKEAEITELVSADNRVRTLKVYRDKIVIEQIFREYPTSIITSEEFFEVENPSGGKVLAAKYNYFWFGLDTSDFMIKPKIITGQALTLAVALMSIKTAPDPSTGFYINTMEFKSEFTTY